MSIAVELTSLAEALQHHDFAYLLTNRAAGAPHAVAVQPTLHGGDLVIAGLGRRTRENALARPDVALVWPPAEAGGYSLIVDGRATVMADDLRVEPTRAVLHRPAKAAPDPDAVAAQGATSARPASMANTGSTALAGSKACGADCIELSLPHDATAAAPR